MEARRALRCEKGIVQAGVILEDQFQLSAG